MKIKYLLCIMILFVSCTKEDAITSREPKVASKFEFPQGDKDYDQELVKIYEKFHVKCIYDNISRDDMNKSWAGSALEGAGNYGKSLDTDELRRFYTIFFRDNIFKYLPPQFVKKVLPQNFYFVQDAFKSQALGINPDGSTRYVETSLARFYGGMDFWSFCFLTEPHIPLSGKPWQENLPVETLDYIKFKEPVLKNILDKMITKNVILLPLFLSIESATDLDYETQVKTNSKEINDPNYFKRRGFPETLRNLMNYAAPATPTNSGGKVKMTPRELFIDYLWLGIRYSRTQIETDYAQFPLVIKYYKMVADYMKTNYEIDLNAMSEEPQLIK